MPQKSKDATQRTKRPGTIADLPAKPLKDKAAAVVVGGGSVGDDSQLTNICLQNALQKQQQSEQILTNVSKQMGDTAMAVIRNMRG